jgi:tRNA (mo5U34)-methyltransferase
MSINEIYEDPRIRWHQRFEIDGVTSPGYHDMDNLIQIAQLPTDLSGLTIIDVGTTNGATAFECERRGAEKVVAVDLCEPSVFGFDKLSKYLGSQVEFLQASVYELPARLNGRSFDYCIFWGVLYHLRHPLLGLDALNQITNQFLSIETVISSAADTSASFFRSTELSNDGSNWWAPSETCLAEMLRSSGFDPTLMQRWDAAISERALMNCSKVGDIPEYLAEGYDSEIFSVEFSKRRANRVV